MTAISALLITVVRALATLRSIGIDSCVDVQVEEVRRLADIELQTSSEVASEPFDVVVSCKAGTQELRLTNRASERVVMRSIDLSATGAHDRDARARELALVIAELVRRANERPGIASPVPASATAAPLLSPARPRKSSTWRAQLGASAVVDAATGGAALFGADVAARVHLSTWLVGELRLGGRKTRAIELESGKVDGAGLTGSVGLAFDATPQAQHAGVALGARLGAAALRYSIVREDGDRLGVPTAPALSASATLSSFIALSPRFCLLLDASVGGPLRGVTIRENERLLSALSGVLLSSSVGVAAQF